MVSFTLATFCEISQSVFEDRAPLYTPAPPTRARAIKQTRFPESIARMAAAYPAGPPPMTTRSKRSSVIFNEYNKFVLIACQHLLILQNEICTSFATGPG